MTRPSPDGAAAPPAYVVRAARADDAERLAPKLRAADRAELQALTGRPPQDGLEEALANSVRAFAVQLSEGEVAMLFGVGAFPVDPRSGLRLGAPWLLGSDRLVELRVPFLRQSRRWVEEIGAGFDLLTNIVDARNSVHIRWLGWAGFTFLRRLPAFGPERRPFLEFVHLVKGGRDV